MAKQTSTRRARNGQTASNKMHTRVNIEYRDISEIKAYDFNPRDNAPAIESVANSIKTFGFLIPVVVDENDVLVAGHTRVAAAQSIGMAEVPVVKVTHLSEDEVNAFRVIDNKVAELAKWDFDLLSGELQKLQGSGLTFTDFGWSREDLDCLTAVVQDDCLSAGSLIDDSVRDRIRRTERRAPATARFVMGELVFFVPATDYRRWLDSLRVQYDYNETDIVAVIKQRLGITEENVVATNRARRTRQQSS